MSDRWNDLKPLPWPGDANFAAFKVGYQLGLEAAIDALKADDMPSMAGVKFARLAVEAVWLKTRMDNYTMALKVVAAAGKDLDTHEIAIRSDGVLVRPLDLVERSAA